ncbi:MAG TPA: SDR family oxidoreductase [Steroidobacteraceae bacterium]|nr:SDR family oxidoreductase [Steroidobacteraceae bacterium]
MSRRGFQGAAVVVTGGGSGLGRAIALRFAAAGANIALLDIDTEALVASAAAVRALGARCLSVPCDVRDAPECAAAIDRAVGEFGRLDVLVNNAGISHRSAFATTDPAVLRRVMEVNFFGAVQATHAALAHLRRSNGLIIVISSVAGFAPLIARTGYAASKHALHGFFESLRTELSGDGVDILMVCPSFIATGIDAHALGADGQPARQAQLVVGRRLSPEAVADRIFESAAAGRTRLLVGRTAWLAWWLSRLAPSAYARLMARRLRGELGQD